MARGKASVKAGDMCLDYSLATLVSARPGLRGGLPEVLLLRLRRVLEGEIE